jgi:hypothetical protein
MKSFVKNYRNAGFSFFPLPYRSKKPFKGWNWRILQTRRPTQTELIAWFDHHEKVNVAIVTGRISGNLAVLDFDDMAVYATWLALAKIESATVQTGNGCHVYVKIADPESIHNGDFQVQGRHGGQLRFDGGYVVAPPSMHPSGNPYCFVKTGIETVTFARLQIEQAPQKGLAKERVMSTNVDIPVYTLKISQSPRVKHPGNYAREAVRREAEKIRFASPGTRNNTVFQAGLKTRKYVDLLGSEVLETLVKAGLASGLSEQESRQTIVKSWKYARY